MTNLKNKIIFNRFPVDKDFFFELLSIAFNADIDLAILFQVEPSMYDKIYFTMTQGELESVAKKRGDPELADCFPGWDALYSYPGRCIILHIPAMAQKLSKIPLREDDPKGKILFTIHFWGCLFHELGHSLHMSGFVVDQQLNQTFSESCDSKCQKPRFDEDESEKYALKCEDETLQKFIFILSNNGLSIGQVADKLFDWDKLGPTVMSFRKEAS